MVTIIWNALLSHELSDCNVTFKLISDFEDAAKVLIITFFRCWICATAKLATSERILNGERWQRITYKYIYQYGYGLMERRKGKRELNNTYKKQRRGAEADISFITDANGIRRYRVLRLHGKLE